MDRGEHVGAEVLSGREYFAAVGLVDYSQMMSLEGGVEGRNDAYLQFG